VQYSARYCNLMHLDKPSEIEQASVTEQDFLGKAPTRQVPQSKSQGVGGVVKSKSNLRQENFFAFALALALAIVSLPFAHAQTFSVVHNFTGGSDGGSPLNGFVSDSTGNLYGTTSGGGASSYGVVYKLTLAGVQTVLHNFAGGADGANPDGFLVRDKAGNLYGTTTAGGADGAGTIFKVTTTGAESVLYSFTGKIDGSAPESGLAIDAIGNLYGTTTAGGAHSNGTVFKLTLAKTGTRWLESTLYSFAGGTDGAVPVAGVTVASTGNIYGTTSAGGAYGYGTVFELSHSGTAYTETILHSFANETDGSIPYGGLIADKSGNLYGAATQGGSNGGGTIFELTSASGSWTFNVLYSVPGWGISGSFRDLMLSPSGVIYGTTHCDGNNNAGTVWELAPASGSWNYTLLYTFTGGTDGLYSFSNLVMEKGKLYGTTNEGGADNYGVVFEVTP
jgi:uncharacterized repeat protein (TIGR03803 family)